MDKEILENIYDDEEKAVEIEGIFTLDELEKIVEFMREKEKKASTNAEIFGEVSV